MNWKDIIAVNWDGEDCGRISLGEKIRTSVLDQLNLSYLSDDQIEVLIRNRMCEPGVQGETLAEETCIPLNLKMI